VHKGMYETWGGGGKIQQEGNCNPLKEGGQLRVIVFKTENKRTQKSFQNSSTGWGERFSKFGAEKKRGDLRGARIRKKEKK